MTREQIKQKNAEREKAFNEVKQEIIAKVEAYNKWLDEDMKKKTLDMLYWSHYNNSHTSWLNDLYSISSKFMFSDCVDKAERYMWFKNNVEIIFDYLYINYDNLLDSEIKTFDGDIIITDPCYILTEKDQDNDNLNLYRLNKLGITNYLVEDTLYGDWDCTVFSKDTVNKDSKVLGHFCADASIVAVLDLNEVLKYNPNFDYHISRPWTTALIKDFKGTVQIVKEEDKWYDEKEKRWEYNYNVKVKGNGINKVTDELIMFVSEQTAL